MLYWIILILFIFLVLKPKTFVFVFVGIFGNTFFIPLFLTPIALIGKLLGYNLNMWEINSDIVEYFFGIKRVILGDEKCIEKGFIIPNHRSFTDFYLDPYITRSSIVGRTLAFFAVSFYAFLGYFIDKRLIAISRTDKREHTFAKLVNHMKSSSQFKNRIVFFPEGTRKNYMSLASIE